MLIHYLTRKRLFFPFFALILMIPDLALGLTPDQVYEKVRNSVVVVEAYDQRGKVVGFGSGVVLPSGDIVTNYHVIAKGSQYKVSRTGKTNAATKKAFDRENDLALLSVPGLVATPARLGQANRLKVGERVYAVGAPEGLELSLSDGIVSQLRGPPPHLIQTTAAVSQGSSGGGLFNAEGELVGITTFKWRGENLNFALPVEWISEIARRGDCLEYEPATVKLTGKVLREVCPGPPNFESVEKGDEKRVIWFLNLEKPVCVKGGENSPINIPVYNILKIQLVLNSAQYITYKKIINKNVIVTGQLYHSHTGHHYTDVLLIVKTIAMATYNNIENISGKN